MKKILFAVLLCLPMLGFAQGVAYTVKSATAEFSHGGVEQNRAPGIQQAAKQALPQLLRNLTPQNVWHRHAEALQALSGLDVVHKASIVSEKTSPNYQLVVDITFNADVVKRVLTDLQISYSEVEAVDLLFLPVLDLPPRQLMWEEYNPWRKAMEWQIKNQSKGVVRPVLPVGDATEMSLISPKLALLGAEDLVRALAKQYGLENVVVSHAQVVYEESGRYLLVKNHWYGGEKVGKAVTQLSLPADGNFEEALQRAAEQSLAQLADVWHNTALVQVDRPDRLFLRITPEQPADLQRLQKILAAQSSVKNIKMKMFSLKNAVLQVDFFGDAETFIETLQTAGLVLEQEGGLWKVAFGQAVEKPAQ